jgi:hypothetical protein
MFVADYTLIESGVPDYTVSEYSIDRVTRDYGSKERIQKLLISLTP